MIDDIVEQHKILGQAVAKLIVDHMTGLDSRRVTPELSPADIERLFEEPFPERGVTVADLLKTVREDVVPNSMLVPSPRYFGQFNPTPLPVSVWADALVSALNQNAGAWRNGPASAIIEARVIRWLCDLVGYEPHSFGTLASGGSEANLIALKCARDQAAHAVRDRGLRVAPGDLVIYASDQCHYSIDKSADILGLGRENVRKIPTDRSFHIRLDELQSAIDRDRSKGKIICCIVGVAGTTSMGVIDPLDALADFASENKCWYHIDAAYGASLAFSEKHQHQLKGIARANSITFDPHKWMFVPFACGATLVRDGASVLRRAFDMSPEYLSEDRGGADVEFDFFRYGQMGTRRFNSLKLWMAMKFMGRTGYAEIIERQIGLTLNLAERLDAMPGFQRIGEVETAVCCFRFVPGNQDELSGKEIDKLQQKIQQNIEQGGEAWLTTTILRGRRALRVNINSFLTEQRHVDDLLDLLARAT
ncbi:MAG TPA: aminotransferase class V-fold PLP-dependent enzyme, partial [Pyrinomonadaceae bacterium]|nr:aminotransferase class V-fold PLP-dependent enzyme [Pyrinomonadaceae bacterium]